ncbi:MAG: hypothetical protein ACYSSN_09000 [Planctomycetota bacterium]|jgi:hypothetical protein
MMRIMFDDLNKYAQRRLLAKAGIKSPEEMNWDVEPIAIVDIEEDDDYYDDDMDSDSMENLFDYGHDEP